MFTRCSPVFTRVFTHVFTRCSPSCSPGPKSSIRSCSPLFTRVHRCSPMFTRCSPMFTGCSPMFTGCSPVFTRSPSCSPPSSPRLAFLRARGYLLPTFLQKSGKSFLWLALTWATCLNHKIFRWSSQYAHSTYTCFPRRCAPFRSSLFIKIKL